MRYYELIDIIKMELEEANISLERMKEYNRSEDFEKGMATGEKILCEYLLKICGEDDG